MDFLSINNNYYNGLMENTATGMTTKKLTDSVKKAESTTDDEELMKISHIDGADQDNDNEYMSMFKDSFIKDKAELLTENTDLGIAKMLYESMKRNTTSAVAGESIAEK